MNVSQAIKLSNALFEAGLMTTYVNPSGGNEDYSVAIYSNALETGNERITLIGNGSIAQYRVALVTDIDFSQPLAFIDVSG